MNTVLNQFESNTHHECDVRYARYIQNSILPQGNNLSHLFADSFLIFKPKMNLSGDFYWFKSKEGKAYFAIVDCTGHGISGAFLSLIGTVLLNQALKEEKTGSPADILKYINQNLQETFPDFQTDTKFLDGMDMGLCCYDFYTQKLEYAGAKRPLTIIREDHIIEINGSRKTLGNESTYYENFELNSIQLRKGDKVYLYTDGITDQFGGTNNKKFTSERLQRFLWANRTLSMQAQKMLLQSEIQDWIGENEQTDDISIMGISI